MVIEQGHLFKPWNPDNEHTPEYWKTKKQIKVSDEISLNTIEDICHLFGADPNKTKRGFLRKGGIPHPKNKDILLWWPSERSRSGWQNNYNDENGTITETHSDIQKKIDHFNYHVQNQQIRYVFFHCKDILGFKNYKFLGIFKNDLQRSNSTIGTVWVKIGSSINLDINTYQ